MNKAQPSTTNFKEAVIFLNLQTVIAICRNLGVRNDGGVLTACGYAAGCVPMGGARAGSRFHTNRSRRQQGSMPLFQQRQSATRACFTTFGLGVFTFSRLRVVGSFPLVRSDYCTVTSLCSRSSRCICIAQVELLPFILLPSCTVTCLSPLFRLVPTIEEAKHLNQLDFAVSTARNFQCEIRPQTYSNQSDEQRNAGTPVNNK
ncbi:hypothetical protein M513_00009 [Trichuris suis]|uniref:Uncharacterized protein n=1 Tax=Trichuris suis TaxID=68888 RepID=A0A085MNQ0_9BILA|nr:hypothetical protein M513_00009 [Trichuris suis]